MRAPSVVQRAICTCVSFFCVFLCFCTHVVWNPLQEHMLVSPLHFAPLPRTVAHFFDKRPVVSEPIYSLDLSPESSNPHGSFRVHSYRVFCVCARGCCHRCNVLLACAYFCVYSLSLDHEVEVVQGLLEIRRSWVHVR